jgi:hypothetical protein
MFSFFANKLTHLSGNYVDFSRMSILLRSGHRYNQEEILARGAVIAMTAASGFLFAYLNDENVTHCSDTTLAITGSVLGLIGAHRIFGNSIFKRIKMGKECEALCESITAEAKEIPVDPIIKKIYTLS